MPAENEPGDPWGDLEALARHLRSHAALHAKAEIALVSEVVGRGSWVHGPGDDGAVVRMRDGADPADGHVIACGEALLPAFVAGDPYGAGFAAVLTNVNDLAAMGATPRGIVDTIVGTPEVAREALRGMHDASRLYAVPLRHNRDPGRDPEPDRSLPTPAVVPHGGERHQTDLLNGRADVVAHRTARRNRRVAVGAWLGAC